MNSANQQPSSNNIMSKGVNPLGEEVLMPVGGIVATTTTPLAANAKWGDTWKEIDGAEAIHVSLSSDQPGTYKVQFSLDGVNPIDYMPGTMTYNPTTQVQAFQVVIAPKAKFVKFIFTNGATAQTTFFCRDAFCIVCYRNYEVCRLTH